MILFLKFEVSLFFHVMQFFFLFFLFAYEEIRPHRIWWKELRQSTH